MHDIRECTFLNLYTRLCHLLTIVLRLPPFLSQFWNVKSILLLSVYLHTVLSIHLTICATTSSNAISRPIGAMGKKPNAGDDPFKLPPKTPPPVRNYGGAYTRQCEDISHNDDQRTENTFQKIRERAEKNKQEEEMMEAERREAERRARERGQEPGREAGAERKSPGGKLKDKLKEAVEDSKTGAKLAKDSAKYAYENSVLYVEETGIKVKKGVQKGVDTVGRKLSREDSSPGMVARVPGFDTEFSAGPKTEARYDVPSPVPVRKSSLPETLKREARRFKEAFIDLPHQGIDYYLNNNQQPRVKSRSQSHEERPRTRTHRSLPSDPMTGETLPIPGQDPTPSRNISYGGSPSQLGDSTQGARPALGSPSPSPRHHPTPPPDIGFGRVYYHYGENRARARPRPRTPSPTSRDGTARSSRSGSGALIDRLGNSFARVSPERGSLAHDPCSSTTDFIESMPDFSTPPPSPPPPTPSSPLSEYSISEFEALISKTDHSESLPGPSSPPSTPTTPLPIPHRFNRLLRPFRGGKTTANLPTEEGSLLKREDSLKRERESSGSGPSSAKPPSKRHEGDDGADDERAEKEKENRRPERSQDE